MKDVELGTGRTKFAWLALITGFSTTLEFVSLSLTNAIHSIGQEPACLAMKDTT